MTRYVLLRYLLRLFLTRAALIVLGLTAILLLFDVLANADRVVGGGGAITVSLLAYGGLRLPEVVNLVVPLAILLAAMTTFAQLVVSSEMVAVRAAGISIYRAAAALLLGAAAIAAAHFWFANAVLPETAGRLRLWEARDFAGLPPDATPRRAPTWFAVGDALVHAGRSTLDGTRLYDVTVVQRDAAGRLTDYLTAHRAWYDGAAWVLYRVRRPGDTGQGAESLPQLRVELPVRPERFSALAGTPAELSLLDILRLRWERDLGSRPDYFYATWLHHKLAHPLGSLVMVLLAAPLALQLARRNRLLIVACGVIGAGFLFFIAERLLLALGETGLLPPAIAAWTPAALFSLLALWVLVTIEG